MTLVSPSFGTVSVVSEAIRIELGIRDSGKEGWPGDGFSRSQGLTVAKSRDLEDSPPVTHEAYRFHRKSLSKPPLKARATWIRTNSQRPRNPRV